MITGHEAVSTATVVDAASPCPLDKEHYISEPVPWIYAERAAAR
jgi:hypothetical protein